ncbi:arogenate dehydrogenase 2, chloroplastic isoform X1 [Elaeis guineensis]|uniref:Arogenate dehydrogenase 2, chloroplastic isoform X1 n=1 Tax=Elaeis guineensis var. tenera TaxID=51953 RepID=A0A6J0PQY5_ELAGV|nr:arogenate dehydrogenase 2, chloroplastic isoform X1 [Elaeis guineensis]XP_019710264.1 arogenate dehydrogenase 2, chloroplastic isoform X1 [Elaeis guineensis]
MASSSSTPLPNGPLKIAIIGFGPFAQFLAQTFLKQGHILAATSRSDYSLLCSQLGITFYRDMDDLMEAGIQVILLCTSILSSGDVIRSIPIDRLRMPLLFVDVLSVKEYPRELLLRVLPEEADVLCTHPMFGPESGKEGWNGLPLVYEKVRIRDHALCDNYLGVFQAEGCRMVEMSCQEHDEMAAKSQFLAHTLGRILAEMGIESTPMDTKGFQTLLQLRDNTMKDSFDLYCGLFARNKFARQELEKLDLAFKSVREKLLERTKDLELD